MDRRHRIRMGVLRRRLESLRRIRLHELPHFAGLAPAGAAVGRTHPDRCRPASEHGGVRHQLPLLGRRPEVLTESETASASRYAPNTSWSAPSRTTTVLSIVIVVFITGMSKCPAA